MPKVTEEYRDAKRREISDAAARAFGRKGFHATSMADIISEAGLSAGAIYGHYNSKSDLVLDVATRVVGSRLVDLERLAAVEPMPAPAAIVRTLMTGMLDDLGSTGIIVQLWGEAVTDPTVNELIIGVLMRLRAAYAGYISLWHQREHGLSPDAGAELAEEQVALFLSAVQGFILQSSLIPDFDAEAYLVSLEKYLPR